MMPLNGIIGDFTVPWLFYDLIAEKKTGTAIFGFASETKKIFMQEGNIVFASSTLVDDRIGSCMIKTGAITEAERDKSLEEALRTGKSFGAVIIENNLIQPRQLVEALQYQVRQITISTFNFMGGCYIFDVNPRILDNIPIKLAMDDFILDGIRSVQWEVINRAFPEPMNMQFCKTSGRLTTTNQAKLDTNEITTLALIDGRKTVLDLSAASRIGDLNTIKALYSLYALHAIKPCWNKEADVELRYSRVLGNWQQ